MKIGCPKYCDFPKKVETSSQIFPSRFNQWILPFLPFVGAESVAPEALISCMVLDVFHPWPKDALIDVAERFMVVLEKNIPNEDETLIALMMVDDDAMNGIR